MLKYSYLLMFVSHLNAECDWDISFNLVFSIHTQTHNRFTALLDFVRDYPGELAPER